jgi:thioesterase domain-containing protein/acyl carrier protein
MAEIWQEVLGVEKVGIEDNFFEIGGYSLKAISLIAKIREKLGVEIPYDQFFRTPRIKELAQYGGQAGADGIHDSYITFNAKQNARYNLFFFPPAVPLGLIYRQLSCFLNDCTLYCFNVIEGENKIIEYVSTITAIQPQGPYILAGFSAGGVLTYEVARELEKRGYSAEIILIDCQYVEIDLNCMDLLMERADAHVKNMAISSEEKERIKIFVRDKTMGYINYLNSLINDEKITSNIYYIYSPHKQDMSVIGAWAQKTTGIFVRCKGYGPHEAMLESGYAEENAYLVREILRGLSGDDNLAVPKDGVIQRK